MSWVDVRSFAALSDAATVTATLRPTVERAHCRRCALPIWRSYHIAYDNHWHTHAWHNNHLEPCDGAILDPPTHGLHEPDAD